MSEDQKLPTLPQIQKATQDAVTRLGVLDYELRVLADRQAAVHDRMGQIEGEKAKLVDVLNRLETTRKVVEQKSKEAEASEVGRSESAGA